MGSPYDRRPWGEKVDEKDVNNSGKSSFSGQNKGFWLHTINTTVEMTKASRGHQNNTINSKEGRVKKELIDFNIFTHPEFRNLGAQFK